MFFFPTSPTNHLTDPYWVTYLCKKSLWPVVELGRGFLSWSTWTDSEAGFPRENLGYCIRMGQWILDHKTIDVQYKMNEWMGE